ncbi:hypothetical protein SEVIR_5G025201v4 [Setaria viridis]
MMQTSRADDAPRRSASLRLRGLAAASDGETATAAVPAAMSSAGRGGLTQLSPPSPSRLVAMRRPRGGGRTAAGPGLDRGKSILQRDSLYCIKRGNTCSFMGSSRAALESAPAPPSPCVAPPRGSTRGYSWPCSSQLGTKPDFLTQPIALRTRAGLTLWLVPGLGRRLGTTGGTAQPAYEWLAHSRPVSQRSRCGVGPTQGPGRGVIYNSPRRPATPLATLPPSPVSSTPPSSCPHPSPFILALSASALLPPPAAARPPAALVVLPLSLSSPVTVRSPGPPLLLPLPVLHSGGGLAR